jgi:hypothetical protein
MSLARSHRPYPIGTTHDPHRGSRRGELDTAKHTGADVARADLDPGDGHPARITIDPSKNAVDDELCYTISDYTPAPA